MKAYTDLEQSKKLEKILPLENADMKWMYWKSEIDAPKVPTFGYGKFAAECYNNNTEGVYLPCWSLAALLEIIPSEIISGEYIINITEGSDNKWCISYDNIDNRNYSFYGLSLSADNLVNACVEMILKLHELKML